ncbi:NAD(P)-binding protein [Coniochaeta ligniaria NRRL 30616]|uniref:NAD(P)-binding protein n=1 Tax=Coniochaeta ligniaria NRRL 30616 TaxID=1408157 RepID=A0A1J7IMP4_9PEZI|nr:NAD(P)-binding protein [Coniochaeta ligniaria NRRL 30616]
MSLPTVFVTSATGSQGGAVARLLRSQGYPVHATVRDPSSPAAQALSSIGVTLTAASWDDEPALAAAMAGCTKVFLNLMPSLFSLDDEVVWGERIVRLAKEAGVDHLIYASGAYIDKMDRLTGLEADSIVAHTMRSKLAIEGAVRAAGFAHYTILRGGFFMANFVNPKAGMMYPSLVSEGVWVTAIGADVPVPLIDTEDIGRFAVAAFRAPEKFGEVDLVWEYRTPGEIVEALAKAAGREMRVKVLTEEEVEEESKRNVFIKAQSSVGGLGRFVDLERVGAYGVPMTTFAEYLEREKESVMQTYGHLPAAR